MSPGACCARPSSFTSLRRTPHSASPKQCMSETEAEAHTLKPPNAEIWCDPQRHSHVLRLAETPRNSRYLLRAPYQKPWCRPKGLAQGRARFWLFTKAHTGFQTAGGPRGAPCRCFSVQNIAGQTVGNVRWPAQSRGALVTERGSGRPTGPKIFVLRNLHAVCRHRAKHGGAARSLPFLDAVPAGRGLPSPPQSRGRAFLGAQLDVAAHLGEVGRG
jgi:hypothetical protein